MTFNGVMAPILRYFSGFGRFPGANCVKVVEDINLIKLSATEMYPKASSC